MCDENKKMNKDFKCDKNLLISNMKYFEKYLSDSKSLDDIDISVHCDIGIFDWLMRFIHHKDPIIEIKNSVSILISSDFFVIWMQSPSNRNKNKFRVLIYPL